MSDPIVKKQLPEPTAQGYVCVNANMTNYAGKNIPGLSAEAGGRVNIGGAFFDLQGSVGTNYGLSANMGYDFDFKKDMGLELSVGASMKGEFVKQEVSICTKQEDLEYSFKYESGFADLRYKAAAKYTYEPEWGSIKVGVEGGYRAAYGSLYVDDNIIINDRYTINKGQPMTSQEIVNLLESGVYKVLPDVKQKNADGIYVTPTVEAEVNLGKGFSAVANADMYGGKAGIKYTFGKAK